MEEQNNRNNENGRTGGKPAEMKNVLILIVLLVALIGGATLVYGALADRVQPNEDLSVPVESGDGDPSSAPETSGLEESSASTDAPDFTVQDTGENSVALSSLRGKPVVLNFWASWCPPCRSEMPDFEKVYQELGDDVQFMMVNLTDGQQETVELATAYIEEEGFTFPVYFDTESDAAAQYGIMSIPSTFFISADGKLISHNIGMISHEQLMKGIGEITAEG